MILIIFWNFHLKSMFFYRDTEISSKFDFCDMSVTSAYSFWKLNYLDKETFFLDESFRIFLRIIRAIYA
jgi:hypothetical protein